MMLQKTFHLSQPLDECKARLASIQSYRRQFAMVTHAAVPSPGTVYLNFRTALGFKGHTVLSSLETDAPDQVAFESEGGNLDVMGIIEFTEIRPDCTEVNLAIHYTIGSTLYAWLDSRFGFIDRFINTELRGLRAHFEGVAAPVRDRMPVLSHLETVAA